ncbi:hypothetical protein QR685DRAFT_97005 [Neurospora intermedia]|uniref:Uncharacterized protein n=1 Tax=Neurospora intermedia TaxID=5142 RepID=A0ABR3D158_NEUIN
MPWVLRALRAHVVGGCEMRLTLVVRKSVHRNVFTVGARLWRRACVNVDVPNALIKEMVSPRLRQVVWYCRCLKSWTIAPRCSPKTQLILTTLIRFTLVPQTSSSLAINNLSKVPSHKMISTDITIYTLPFTRDTLGHIITDQDSYFPSFASGFPRPIPAVHIPFNTLLNPPRPPTPGPTPRPGPLSPRPNVPSPPPTPRK